ncbi:peptidoglycan-binding domain-containing protein [Streptomyces sp. GS7]|uniref:peptidoglycan-binding domain-containing protein n=1 Tax=Streptomyces sp. GS7 TaxID=2692234 RepID=UPI003FA68604
MPAGSSHRTAGQRVGHAAERRTASGGAGGARPGHRLSSRHGGHPDEKRRTRRPVRALQARLTRLGLFRHAPTGCHATETATAPRAFQKQSGRPPTGEFTTADRSALLSRTRKPDGGEPYRRNSGRDAPSTAPPMNGLRPKRKLRNPHSAQPRPRVGAPPSVSWGTAPV